MRRSSRAPAVTFQAAPANAAPATAVNAAASERGNDGATLNPPIRLLPVKLVINAVTTRHFLGPARGTSRDRRTTRDRDRDGERREAEDKTSPKNTDKTRWRAGQIRQTGALRLVVPLRRRRATGLLHCVGPRVLDAVAAAAVVLGGGRPRCAEKSFIVAPGGSASSQS